MSKPGDNDGSNRSEEAHGSTRAGNGRDPGPSNAALDDDAGPDLGGDIVAFFLVDLASVGDENGPDGAIEKLRKRALIGGRLVQRVGFDRARPYLLKLRELWRLVLGLLEVPGAPLD
jgi:hypothetical protein